MSLLLSILVVGIVLVGAAAAHPPQLVSNVHVSQRVGTKRVVISYNIAYNGGPVSIWIQISNDGGCPFIAPAKTFADHSGQYVPEGITSRRSKPRKPFNLQHSPKLFRKWNLATHAGWNSVASTNSHDHELLLEYPAFSRKN